MQTNKSNNPQKLGRIFSITAAIVSAVLAFIVLYAALFSEECRHVAGFRVALRTFAWYTTSDDAEATALLEHDEHFPLRVAASTENLATALVGLNNRNQRAVLDCLDLKLEPAVKPKLTLLGSPGEGQHIQLRRELEAIIKHPKDEIGITEDADWCFVTGSEIFTIVWKSLLLGVGVLFMTWFGLKLLQLLWLCAIDKLRELS